jgi:hypothetical protein
MSPRRLTSLAAALLTPVLAVALGAAPVPAATADPVFTPGSPGIGDEYFPLAGNGGYDVSHYGLAIRYQPRTDVLVGRAAIRARATQDLSRFDLDLDGLTVRSVRVDGRRAAWRRDGGELVITPSRGLRSGRLFTTVVRYDGVPQTLPDGSGFVHTDDGALVIGEPQVASTWFPVNDHPSDKASYTFHVTAPRGIQTVANGILTSRRAHGAWRTWTWQAREPMASYLATASMGRFDLHFYRHRGIWMLDAIDPDLLEPVASPRTGSRFAISQRGEPSYKRLARTITVPAAGGDLSFWVNRKTEPGWDHFFVEAHTVGQQDWTTLPDENGHSSDEVGSSCPYWLDLHPFLEHYQTEDASGSCTPSGTTGTWSAASGASDGYESWKVDLSAYAGQQVEVALSYVSDDSVQLPGVFIDDVTVPSGAGSTSFEDDGDTWDGWTTPGAPAGSAANPNTWIAGTTSETPPSAGVIARRSFARHGEILDFLASSFGPYPFTAAGGIVDDAEGLGFALENQTRPIYALDFFTDQVRGTAVVVHELAHQWYGDSLSVRRWRDIWLNEGFASYAEWLWSEHEGQGTAQETFDAYYSGIPADDPFWELHIGDPGPDRLFDGAVYDRGAMTLHALRMRVGDADFFTILRTWARTHAGGNVSTPQFVRLAERVSGQQLDGFFDAWLFTSGKPAAPTSSRAKAAAPPVTADRLLEHVRR